MDGWDTGTLGHWATGSKEANAANPTHHVDFAKNEGFEAIPKCATAHLYSLREIEDLLRNHGPIFMYWFKKNSAPWYRETRTVGDGSYGHASVIVGTDLTGLLIHDPKCKKELKGAKIKMSLNDFNKSRQIWPWALMQKAGKTKFDVARRM